LLHSSGGQLFSYCQHDRDTKFLCLYASRLIGEKIEYANLIVQVEDRPEVIELSKTNPDELAGALQNCG